MTNEYVTRTNADCQRAYRGPEQGFGRLLQAKQAELGAIREWPFDAPTMLRFALYLAIPLGSWLGGAFIKRLLGPAHCGSRMNGQ